MTNVNSSPARVNNDVHTSFSDPSGVVYKSTKMHRRRKAKTTPAFIATSSIRCQHISSGSGTACYHFGVAPSLVTR